MEKKLFYLFILSLVCCLSLRANDAHSQLYNDYYQLEKELITATFGGQMKQLDRFLQSHPDFYPVYNTLYELLIMNRDADAAHDYFTKLYNSPRTRTLAAWMLARISIITDQPLEARNYFITVLTPPAPFTLLYDIAKFAASDSTQLNIDTFTSELQTRDSQILSALYMYYRKNDEAAAIKKLEELNRDDAETTLFLAHAFLYKQDYQKSSNILQKFRSRIINPADKSLVFLYYEKQAKLFYHQNKYNQALVYCDSMKIITTQTLSPGLLAGQNELEGYIHYDNGHYENALSFFQKSLPYYSCFNKKSDLIYIYLYLGLSCSNLTDFAGAINNLQKSLYYAALTKNFIWESYVRTQLGNQYLYINLLELSALEMTKALETGYKSNDKNLIFSSQKQLAVINVFQGNYSQARTIFTNLLNDYTINNYTDQIPSIYYNLGYIAEKENKYSIALKRYQQTITLLKNTPDPLQYWSLLRTAVIYSKTGKGEQADDYFTALLRSPEVQKNKILSRNIQFNYGKVLESRGEPDKAIPVFREALGNVESYRTHPMAEAARIGLYANTYDASRGLARCYALLYRQTHNPAMLDSLLYYEEIGRARSMKDRLNRTGLQTMNPAYISACSQLQQQQHHLRAAAGMVREQEEWDALISGLDVAKYNVVSQQMQVTDTLNTAVKTNSPINTQDIKTLQNTLRRNRSAMLMYHIDAYAAYILVVTPDSAGIVPVNTQTETLSAQIDSLMLPLRNVKDLPTENIIYNARVAHRLYNLLFAPAQAAFNLPENILVVAEESLLNLPFDILLQHQPAGNEYLVTDPPEYTGSMLLNDYVFYYSPTSVTSIPKHKFSGLFKKEMLVIANPATQINEVTDIQLQLRERTGWNFMPLPYSEQEAAAIKKTISGARIYTRDNADEQLLKRQAPNYRLLHIATHAFADTTWDSFSGMMLSTSKDTLQDGILMGYEINNIKLDCDLVTLSACETGRGNNVKAEGVLGLPRLFITAGARSVLMSLWKVDDRFTFLLMADFYEKLVTDKNTKAKALAQAKRALIKSMPPANGMYYQHPFFWAAFSLYGAPGPLEQKSSLPLYAGITGIIFMSTAGAGIVIFRKRKKHS